MSLARRMTLSMSLLVITTAVVIAVLGYYSLYATIVPASLHELELQNERLAAVIETEVRATRADILVAAQVPAVAGVFRARAAGGKDPSDGTPERLWRERLGAVLLGYLNVKPGYLQFRLLDGGPDGRELVRVERPKYGGPIRVVPDDELQAKGGRPYFGATMGLPNGEVAISDFELNVEHGKLQEPHTPVLRMSTPFYLDPSGPPIGMLIVNIGMDRALDRLRATNSPDNANYFVNATGGILIHPERTAEFAFDLGDPTTLKDLEPDLAKLMDPSGSRKGIVLTSDGTRKGAAVTPAPLLSGPLIYIIKTRRYEAMLAPMVALAAPIIAGGAIATIFAIAIVVLFGLRVSKPLREITAAIDRFVDSGEAMPPIVAGGEVGDLARAFEEMIQDIRRKNLALTEEIHLRRQGESELTRRGEAVARAEDRFRRVVESAPSGIIAIDKAGCIVFANPKIEQMFGYTQDMLLGKPIEILVPARYREHHPGMRAHYAANPETRAMGEGRDLYGVRRDGSEFPVEIGLNPMETVDGPQVLGIVLDISERKRAEDKFRLAVESCPSGMVMVDARGKILMVNAETEKLFGYPRAELIGQSIEILVPERFRGNHPGFRDSYAQSPEPRSMGTGRDLHGKRKDGTEFPVEIGLNPIETREGLQVLGVIVDITERKKAEEAIAQYTEDLKRSNEELEQFAYVASHDLQEPLRMVASYTALLSERYKGQLDEKADKYIYYAVDGAKRMKLLIDDLLTYSRVDRQGKPFEAVDADSVVASVIHSLKNHLAEVNGRITADPLPVVFADEVQLVQTFQNLISNGLKFHGESPPAIHVSATIDDTMAQFSVRDNGIGIEEKYAARIFQMFQRLHSRSAYSGNGIGLAVVKKIIERHGGRIWFESKLHEGTTFYFTLPLAKEEK